jgi:hypothetical protein
MGSGHGLGNTRRSVSRASARRVCGALSGMWQPCKRRDPRCARRREILVAEVSFNLVVGLRKQIRQNRWWVRKHRDHLHVCDLEKARTSTPVGGETYTGNDTQTGTTERGHCGARALAADTRRHFVQIHCELSDCARAPGVPNLSRSPRTMQPRSLRPVQSPVRTPNSCPGANTHREHR